MTPATAESCASPAASVSHLTSSRLPLVALRDFYRFALCSELQQCHSSTGKALVLDQQISSALSLVAEVDLLRRHSIDQIYYLLPGQLATQLVTSCPHIIYCCRPELHLMTRIAAQIQAHTASKQVHTYSLLYMHHTHASLDPSDAHARSVACTRTLQRLGVYGQVSYISSLPLTLLPLDKDVLSLEYPNAFYDLYSLGVTDHLWTIAVSIRQLERLYGHIAHIRGKGNMAVRVFNLVNMMRRNESSPIQHRVKPLIAACILVDRVIDVVTPLLSQSTYEGLIDEQFNIKTNCIQVPPHFVQTSKPAPAAAAAKAVKVSLTSADSLFEELRNMTLSSLGPRLHALASQIQSTYNQRHTHTQTVSDLSVFIKSFKSAHAMHTALSLHLAIASELSSRTAKHHLYVRIQETERQLLSNENVNVAIETIDYCIASRCLPLHRVYALLMLATQCSSGWKVKRYNAIKSLLISVYGCTQLQTLARLERMGMIGPHSARKPQQAVYRAMQQLQSSLAQSGHTHVDLSTVYDAQKHTPLLVSLIQHEEHWPTLAASGALSQLPGRTFAFDLDENTLYDDYVPPLPSAVTAGEAPLPPAAPVSPFAHLTMPVNLLQTASSAAQGLLSTSAAAAAQAAVTSFTSLSIANAVQLIRPLSLGFGASQTPRDTPTRTDSPQTSKPTSTSTNPFADDQVEEPSVDSTTSTATASANAAVSADASGKPIVLVYFIAGCTYSEISAIRRLNADPNATRHYIVCTSKIINQEIICTSLQHNQILNQIQEQDAEAQLA